MSGPFPAVWVSDVDATDPAAGIHCGAIPEPLGHLATGVARRILRLLP